MATILIVDDRAANREFLVTLLGYKGHRTLEAADGAEALVLTKANRPDLVIADILMPTMDGYEFVRQLRADPVMANTAVVFLSAHYHEREAKNLARACGVSHLLMKPCEPEAVFDMIEQALSHAPQTPTPSPAEDFDREHLRLLTNKLSQEAVALDATNERLAALIALSLQFASERDPNQLLDKFCRSSRNLIGARYGVVAVREQEGDKIRFMGTAGMKPELAAGLELHSTGRGIMGEVVTERRSLRLRDLAKNPQTLGLPAQHPPVHTLVAAPVSSPTRTYGWIGLTNKVGAEEFSAEDEQLLTTLAAQAGRIYENGSLYRELRQQAVKLATEIEEHKQADQKVRRLNRVYAVLSGISTLIVRVRDRQELFNEACRIAVDHGNFGIAWIGAYDPSAQEVTPVAWAGLGAGEYLGGVKSTVREDVPQGRGVLAQAIKTRKPAHDNDITIDPAVGGKRRAEAIRRGYRAVMVLPLIVESAVVGTLSLFARELNFFTKEEIKLLTELAADISFALEHIGKEEKLSYFAYYDALTGLPNGVQFHERLTQALRAAKQSGSGVAVLIGDINRFRLINDTFGRHAGDVLLREFAERLQRLWPNPGNIARVASNHFAGIVRDIKEPAEIARLIGTPLDASLSTPFVIDGKELSVSLTAGIAVFPSDGKDADTLYINAEAALKQAKTLGERYQFYEPQMNARIAETLSLENKLRRALEREQFVLHYQPKVDLAKGTIVGLEALIRWNDPETGLVPPIKFVSLLEETGMILEVGRWAIRKALEVYREWYAQGLQPPRIAVNVSPIQIRQKDFVDVVKRVIGECAAECRNEAGGLDLEITESLIMGDIEGNIKKLRAISDTGVNIAIDDFGTGYSSLGYLAKLPVNALKIDRSFIITMMNNADSMTIVSAIISLAHALKLKVVAEGVDAEEQRKLLCLLKCDEMQGYLFSKPLPMEQIEARFLKSVPPSMSS